MTGRDNIFDGLSRGGLDAFDFLGGQADDVALFVLAHAPRRYVPLTEPEIGNLKAAVAGILPEALSNPVRELIRRNAAAVELVMSEQLLANANRKAAVPARLTHAILRRAGSPAEASPVWTRFVPQPRAVWALAAAASLAAIAVFHGSGLSGAPNFEIVALDDDSERQAAGSGAGLKFVEMEEPRLLLADFVADDQVGRAGREKQTLARLSADAHPTENPEYVFDASMKPVLDGRQGGKLPVRIYDLTDPANRPLLCSVHLKVDALLAQIRHEKLDLVVAVSRHA